MEMGLFQEQKVRLTMTNHLQQAISILQYSSLELFEFVQHLSLENPFIEMKESYYNKLEALSKNRNHNKNSLLDFIKSKEPSMADFLINQLVYMNISKEEKNIMTYIIYGLDKDGYFKEDLHEVAAILNVPIHQVEEALQLVQQLEPKGIGATSLEECLLLQLKSVPDSDVAQQIVAQHLDELARNKWKEIASKLAISLKEVEHAYQLIQQLHPKPGLLISKDFIPSYIIPDFTVKMENNKLVLIFNEQTMPQIEINKVYHNLLQSNAMEPNTKTYLQSKFKEVNWLHKSMEQRKRTLYTVMSKIFEIQHEFFTNSKEALKPLTLKEIAEACSIHESTVSRATKNKYVQTPHGLYELKYFFSSSIGTEKGEAASSHTLKQKIAALIQSENKEKPLSDQQITNLLKKEGYSISRRTVAKYREAIGIPASSVRRSK